MDHGQSWTVVCGKRSTLPSCGLAPYLPGVASRRDMVLVALVAAMNTVIYCIGMAGFRKILSAQTHQNWHSNNFLCIMNLV